ncbi:MAG: PilZ domain-containing protein [Gammaproteobacteria bacterium]|nr:PilZ domain-containing protein [Gammaproteobacteria bacterium]
MRDDNRRFARIPLPMEVEVRMEGAEMMVLETIDISNGGAFIKAEAHQCPAVGTELSLRVKGNLGGEEPPTVQARVVRVTSEGFGIRFLTD